MATVTYYFNSYNMFESWETNPGGMSDGSIITFASTTVDNRVENLLTNTCGGANLGIISKVEIRAYGYFTSVLVAAARLRLRPVFEVGDGDNHDWTLPITKPVYSSWYDITSDTNAPDWSSWMHVRDLDFDVENDITLSFPTSYCAIIEIRVTYTPRAPKPTAAVGNPLIFQILSTFIALFRMNNLECLNKKR